MGGLIDKKKKTKNGMDQFGKNIRPRRGVGGEGGWGVTPK